MFGNPDGIVASTRLAPEGGGAPVTIARTAFPGVRVHVGRLAEFAFPNCGCDACDEDVEEQIESLEQLLDAVLAGRFLEGEGVIGSDENGEIVGGIHAYSGEWGSSVRESAVSWTTRGSLRGPRGSRARVRRRGARSRDRGSR